MLKKVDSCLERWISIFTGEQGVEKGGFMLKKVDSCLERWISIFTGEQGVEKGAPRRQGWAVQTAGHVDPLEGGHD
jgi:hypothetical protein